MDLDAEADLIARCRRGDAEAWDALFDAHYDAGARFVFQLGHDFTPEDVEEICQEVFLSVIRNIGSFHGQSRFQTWLFRIAANKARDYRERQHAAKRGGQASTFSLQATHPETGLTIDPPSSAPGPDAAIMAGEELSMVSRSVESMEEPCREIIQLRYFADLSYEEISAALKLNPKTVSSRLSKCLDRLEEIVRQVFAGKKGPIPSNK